MYRALFIPLFLLLAACGSEDPFAAPDLPDDVGVAGDGTLAEVLEPIRAAWDVPALGAILIHQGQVLETAAVGRRSLTSSERVTTQDLWHVGSLTMAMTATLAGVLVEAGHLDWTTTVEQALPDLAPIIRVDRAVEPGPGADIPEALGPAGTVHLSMDDYGKFAAAHIAGTRGVDGLVSAATFARLHQQASGTASGLGWLLGVRVWANGIALHHEGSNQLWYANVWLAPERDFGLLAVTNGGQERGFRTTEQTVLTLIERFDAAQVP